MRNALSLWWRSRIDVFISIVVCLAIVGVAIANAELVTVGKLSVGSNWRGLYDILVTAPGQDFGGASTKGLVDSNFVTAAGAQGISIAQLSRVRAISGVSVAAPIGLVGSLQDAAQTPSLILIDDPVGGNSDLTASPEVLRLTSTLRRETSLGTITLSKSAGVVELVKRNAKTVDDLSSAAASGYPNGFEPQGNNLYYQIPLGALPSFPSTVIAIDPKAEAKLEGRSQSAFLKPLTSLPSDRTTADGAEWAKKVNSSKYLVQQTAIQQAVADKVTKDEVIPLIVNASQSADLQLTVSVQKAVGETASASPNLSTLLRSGTFASPVNITKNVSGLATPFSSPDLAVLLPGSNLPKGNSAGSFYGSSTGLVPVLVSRPNYLPTQATTGDVKTPKFKVVPKGVVAADGSTPTAGEQVLTGQDPSVGLVRAYRGTVTLKGGAGESALAAPVGQFVNSDLQSPQLYAASYVPSGIYDGSTSRLLTKGDGGSATTGLPISANLSGVDFLSSPPGAFTDLQGGEALRGSAPIDAIRVRVAGIDSYSASSRAKIESVAAQIAKLGLQATVVAGSSPQPVEVYVPKYRVGASANSNLGWVRQSWTTLGAAVTVSNALSSTQFALLCVALLAVVLAFAAATLVQARRRRPQSQSLREVGWTDRQIASFWTLSRAPGVVAVIGVSVVSYFLSAGTATDAVALACVCIVAVVSTAIGVWLSSRTGQSRPKRPGRAGAAAITPLSIAARHLSSAPGSLFLQVFGVVAVGTSAAFALAAFEAGRVASGETRLAGVAVDSTQVASLVLGASGVMAAVILTMLGRRAELARRTAEAETLLHIGFSARTIRSILNIESLTVGAVGVVLTGITAAVVAVVSGGGVAVFLLGIAACVVVTVAIIWTGTRKVAE